MTALAGPAGGAFKRALYISGAAHALLLLVIILNPSLPSSRKTGMIHYINLGSLPGGGGGGGGGMRGPGGATETVGETPLSKQTLRDLTTIQKLQQQNQSSLRYPVDKPKRDRSKPVPDKQADCDSECAWSYKNARSRSFFWCQIQADASSANMEKRIPKSCKHDCKNWGEI